ncbi:hypothetical protein LSH36_1086g00008, partial [Paralvinella palmiformis]
ELGFLRKRSSSAQGRCDRQRKAIEFPAVLLNTHNGQIESEFHLYIQPEENPVLSNFCSELTGIKQDKVDQGIPLSICLKKFSRWLKEISEQRHFIFNMNNADLQPRCTFVTWSDWDLGVCLHYETRRKQLRKPIELNSWIDLRATYRTFYQRKPKGLNGALQDLGLTFEGREHSGIIDARNTARLAYRMICDGCVLNITKTMSGPLNCWTLGTLAAAKQTPMVQCGNRNGSDAQQANTHSTILPKSAVSNDTRTSSITHPEKRYTVYQKKASLTSEVSNNLRLENPVKATSCIELKTNSPPVRGVVSDNSKSTNGKQLMTSSIHKRQSNTREYCANSSDIKRMKPPTVANAARHKTPTAFVGNKITGTISIKVSHSGLRDISNVQLLPESSHLSLHKGGGLSDAPTSDQKSFNPAKLGSLLLKRNLCGFDSFKTPLASSSSLATSMKRTPPLCSCGSRAKRKTVQKPGPNLGRIFFCCGANRKKSNGCGFFKWELPSCTVHASPILRACGTKTVASSHWMSHTTGRPLEQPDFGTPQVSGKTKTILV